jgi:2-polyprenyl-6-methoxyphenol hydroxylase-like FAD-dependent oxidoreductase
VIVEYEYKKGRRGTIEADLVIGTDGPSSTIRSLFAPDVERAYAGYVALRGTVQKNQVTPKTREAFQERFTFFHDKGTQILVYLIPGENDTLEYGQRPINFV